MASPGGPPVAEKCRERNQNQQFLGILESAATQLWNLSKTFLPLTLPQDS